MLPPANQTSKTEASTLEHVFARMFGDSRDTAFGSGWMSGTASVFLGFIAVLGVAAFWFPGVFTTEEFRTKYPVAVLRALLQVTIGVSFLLGAVSLLLRERKVLGLTGLVLVFVPLERAFPQLKGQTTFRIGWVDHVITTPRGHHWHHAETPIDQNFAVHLPLLDRLFGTQHLPGNEWPQAYGIQGHPVPEGWLRQLTHPFRGNRRDAAPGKR